MWQRLVAFMDLAAACVSAMLLFVFALIGVRGAAVSIWHTLEEMYAAHEDRWLVLLLVVCLGWCAVRWKAARRAVDEFRD